ncbi:MAG: hypothetical protein AMJ95_08250 [Omnitrophica WOR_2 bacterium SM23_72]|nr:MAG: hypothetical protein AMJ95_08250 [Omnitrophica WOR_2 bacterium SM23_72]
MSDSRDIGHAFVFFGVGIGCFFWGFKRLRRKRKIENIPTSTVRGLAMGLVELVGKAQKRIKLASPLTQTTCVFYRYTVERYKKRGRSGDWVTIASGNSFFSPFWLDDGTGKILVFPQGAEVIMPVDYEFRTGLGKSLPSHLLSFMEQNGLSHRGLFGTHPLRFKEWYILEDETVYVLGTASSQGPEHYLKDYNEKLTQRLEGLKTSPLEMAKLDLDKDGTISAEEWNLAFLKIEKELIEEQLKVPLAKEPMDAFIKKGEKEMFIISDYSQKDLLKHLGWEAIAGVFGGATVALLALCYILFRLKPGVF